MTKNNSAIIRDNIETCSALDFQKTLWQCVEDEMKGILKTGVIDVKMVKALVNYRGNSYGAHAMLLDIGFADLYEDIQDLIREWATLHEDYQRDSRSSSLFEASMADYIEARNAKKAIANKIHNNPLIKNLLENGHYTFASKAARLLINDDERTKSANKNQREAMYDMRAEDFFKTLEKVVKEMGE